MGGDQYSQSTRILKVDIYYSMTRYFYKVAITDNKVADWLHYGL